jgi:hypothetical protein
MVTAMAMVGIAAGAGGNAARLDTTLSEGAAAIGGLFCFRRVTFVDIGAGRIGKSCRGLRPWLRILVDF